MDYKIVFIPKVGESFSFEKEYPTQEQAETAMTSIADYTLMLHGCSLMADWSNCGMVYKKDGSGCWVEIDECGNEI